MLVYDELPPRPGGIVNFDEPTTEILIEGDAGKSFKIGAQVAGLLVELGTSIQDTGEIIYELASGLRGGSTGRTWFTRGAALKQVHMSEELK